MDPVLTASAGHATPSAVHPPRWAGRGTVLRQDFTSGAKQVLTCRLLP